MKSYVETGTVETFDPYRYQLAVIAQSAGRAGVINAKDCLKPGISFEILDKLAHQIGDKQAKVIYRLQNIACNSAADSYCSNSLHLTK